MEKSNTKLIVSHHNFKETPIQLNDIYQRIAKTNADIIKIATKANNYNDSLRMLNLISGADRDIIAICMGQKGMITRVYGPAVGGYLTFASLGEGKSSASGQMNVDELRQTWQLL